jgi:endonuclease/exonuclease/phosphatase (EEP) superfamily protein YafD
MTFNVLTSNKDAAAIVGAIQTANPDIVGFQELTRARKAAINALHEPALLLCDCNLTDTSQAYAQLAAFLVDSFREAGWGFGHSSFGRRPPFLGQRLDYIWHSDRLTAIEARVGPDGGSDHRPVVVKLALRTG